LIDEGARLLIVLGKEREKGIRSDSIRSDSIYKPPPTCPQTPHLYINPHYRHVVSKLTRLFRSLRDLMRRPCDRSALRQGTAVLVVGLLTPFLNPHLLTSPASMSLRTFLCDIVYESSDRIAEAALYSNHLTRQVRCNRLQPEQDSDPGSNVDRDSQMDIDGEEDSTAQSETFFGETPRAIQPLLQRNRRRHEFHASKSSPSSSILQVKAIRQKMNGACGYYSLFHSSMVRSAPLKPITITFGEVGKTMAVCLAAPFLSCDTPSNLF